MDRYTLAGEEYNPLGIISIETIKNEKQLSSSDSSSNVVFFKIKKISKQGSDCYSQKKQN